MGNASRVLDNCREVPNEVSFEVSDSCDDIAIAYNIIYIIHRMI
jgi:hypothetical protein